MVEETENTKIQPDDANPSGENVTPDSDDPNSTITPEEGKAGTPDIQVPEFDDNLLERAEALGLNEDEARSFETPEALRKTLDSHEIMIGRAIEVETKEVSREDREQNMAQLDFTPVDLGETDEFEEEKVKTAVGGLNKQVVKLTAEVNQLRQSADANVVNMAEREFDSIMGSLDEKGQEHFGVGSSAAMNKKSKEFRRRNEIYDSILDQQVGAAARGKDVPTIQQCFKKITGGKFKAVTKKSVQKEILDKAKKVKNVFTNPPSNANISELPETRKEREIREMKEEAAKKNIKLDD